MNNYSQPITKNGGIVSFKAPKGGRVTSLLASLSPIQDLNGYDSPWPAGGGANVFEPISGTSNGITFTPQDDGSINISGTATNASWVYISKYVDLPYCGIEAGDTIVIWSDTRVVVTIYDADSTAIDSKFSNNSVATTFTIPSSATRMQLIQYAKSSILSADESINAVGRYYVAKGSSFSSWTPYENICPISGWTGVEAYRTGKNLLNPDSAAWSVRSAYSYINNVIPSGQVARFTFVDNDTAVDISDISIGFTFNDLATGRPSGFRWCLLRGTIQGNVSNVNLAGNICTNVFINPQNTLERLLQRYNIMVELGSVATDYEPYQDKTTYSLDWTSEAGTVYGGTVDLVSGELTVDRAMVTLDGTNKGASSVSVSSLTGNYGFVVSISGAVVDNSNIMCNMLSNDGTSLANVGNIYYLSNGNMVIVLPDQTLTTVAAVNSWLASNNIQICYYLATPITYQLTPQEISLLAGQNVVWSNAGEVSITYAPLLFVRQKFTVNGVDFSGFVERDSYKTSLAPVYSETVQTIDGVNHTALLRLKGSLTVGLNPQTDTDTAAICAELLKTPCEVIYHCLQRDADVAALMTVDALAATFLSRCLYWGDEWNQIEAITLTEL